MGNHIEYRFAMAINAPDEEQPKRGMAVYVNGRYVGDFERELAREGTKCNWLVVRRISYRDLPLMTLGHMRQHSLN